jgi:hypothetical protein
MAWIVSNTTPPAHFGAARRAFSVLVLEVSVRSVLAFLHRVPMRIRAWRRRSPHRLEDVDRPPLLTPPTPPSATSEPLHGPCHDSPYSKALDAKDKWGRRRRIALLDEGDSIAPSIRPRYADTSAWKKPLIPVSTRCLDCLNHLRFAFGSTQLWIGRSAQQPILRSGWPPERRIAEPVGAYAAVCLPSPRKINLSAVAHTFGWPGCELATKVELEKLLGFSPRGVSPLGLGQIPLIVDEDLFSHSTMLVGGGAIGVDIELDPRDLVRVTNAKAASIAID